MRPDKRKFLQGLAASGAAAWAGLSPEAVAAAARKTKIAVAEPEFDLLIIGAGTAGMPAAAVAAARGARVVLIDTALEIGGTTPRSSGQIAASRTVFQQALGIVDSPEEHYDDIMRINNFTSDPVLTRLFVNNAPAAVNWLAANGFKVTEGHPVTTGGHEPFTKRRYQWGPESGRSLLKVMAPLVQSAAAAGKLALLLNTGAVDLIQDADGSVSGAVVEDAAGVRRDIRARSTVIASGGCASNPRLFEELHNARLAATVAYPFSQGQGLLLGQGAGGYLRGGGNYVPLYGTVLSSEQMPCAPDSGFRSNPHDRPPWEIHVNSQGERFVREDHPGIEYRQHALQKQPGQCLWVIASRDTLDRAPNSFVKWTPAQILEKCNKHPMYHAADDFDTLALRAGINPAGLRRSVADYNDALRTGRPDRFGREHRPLVIAQAPFIAVRATGWTVVSFAGLAVDGELRVIRSDGAPIRNLYAAGEVLGAGSTSGNAYTNGTLLTPAITFGKLLGESLPAGRKS
jgi:fumarate reductase flavoprotein subunit